ncbi:MAG TPA: type IV toxin-antitoxin system AbiEi family antitoxin [Opitutaceae bacterium]|nr:type IV toxin-antitoxin system AbiEi family antitoxin [Opitutaceae bacterium]
MADLNGQLFLRGPGLLVSLPSLPGRRFRFEQEPRNVFVGKSARIVRTLLTDSERAWQQTELVQRTGATSGLVSRIVTYLIRQGLLKKTDSRRFQVASHSALLDAWAHADDFPRRATTYRFAPLSGDPLRLAKALRNVLTHGGPPFGFTQWIAAWLRHPYTEPPVVSLYVAQLPPPDILKQANLQPVNDAGRVWLHVPVDEGVFRERQFVQDLPLVTDAQIYLDLLKTGLRGPEQAQALREWPGFCRP